MRAPYICKNLSEATKRVFILEGSDEERLQISYRSQIPQNDAAYDELDEEQEDFFLFTARLWNDDQWKRAVTREWAPTADGKKPRPRVL